MSISITIKETEVVKTLFTKKTLGPDGYTSKFNSNLRQIFLEDKNKKYFPHTLFFWMFYFFIFRERKGERKRERMCGCLSLAPYWGPGLQPRHVPWPGIEPVTLWFTVRCSVQWATPARDHILYDTKFMIRLQKGHYKKGK